MILCSRRYDIQRSSHGIIAIALGRTLKVHWHVFYTFCYGHDTRNDQGAILRTVFFVFGLGRYKGMFRVGGTFFLSAVMYNRRAGWFRVLGGGDWIVGCNVVLGFECWVCGTACAAR